MFVDFLAIDLLVDLKIVEQVVCATETGALKGIIIGKAIEIPTIPKSETVINIPFQDKHLIFNHISF
jgi:hypothetical protein